MKYSRTPHLPFTQSSTKDDKIISIEDCNKNFINKRIAIFEKLDGGNACLDNENVFARSHSSTMLHPSFSMLKQLHFEKFYTSNFNYERYLIFGENMQAIHSIKYDKLSSVFYIFAVFDKHKNTWLSVKEIIEVSNWIKIPIAPLLGIFEFKTIKELEKFLLLKMKEGSQFGDTIEGFVIRTEGSFSLNDFEENVAKFVRKDHVQTDKHWSNNWKPQTIITIEEL